MNLATIENKREQALLLAETAKDFIKKALPDGVVDAKTDEIAKEILKTASAKYEERKAERLEFTRQLDEIKKSEMVVEKMWKEDVIDVVQAARDKYANDQRRALEVVNYREQFTVMLNATLKSIALDHASKGLPASRIDLSKVLPIPTQAHLKEVHITLATEWQPKATRLYLTYYNEAPGGEAAKEEKELTQAVAKMEIGRLQSETLEYKPKGARTVRNVIVTHPDGLKRLLGLYFTEKGAGVLTDKNFDFVLKWAQKIEASVIEKIEGVTVVEELKTSKR